MISTKRKFVNVTPQSPEAKYRFFSLMDSFHGCVIEEETDSLLLLTSINGQYCFWVQKNGNEHWKVEK